jgi:hypothetical protein
MSVLAKIQVATKKLAKTKSTRMGNYPLMIPTIVIYFVGFSNKNGPAFEKASPPKKAI